MNTLGDMLRRNAHLTPDRPALIFEEREITFAHLLDRANRLASALWQRGIRKGDRVGVLSMNRPEFVEIYSAGELAGFCLSPLNFRLAPSELAWIIGDSDPSLLFFEDQYTDTIEAIRDQLPDSLELVAIGEAPDCYDNYESFLATGDQAGAPSRAEPEDPLHIMYTSGTTGRPKGALRSNRGEFNCARANAEEIAIMPGDLFLIMMPWFHIGARAQQASAMWRGVSVLMHRGFDPGKVLEDIERYGVTATHMAPTLVHDCFEHPDFAKRDVSSLKTIYYSAAPMPLPLLKRGLERLGPVFTQCYGMTEGTGTCLHKIDHVLEGPPEKVARLRSVGQAQVNSEMAIIDDAWNHLPAGEIGELAMKTDGMMEGYWKNPEATAEAIRDGWLRTGDIGYMDEQGYVFLVDRKKDMIVSGGENIYSREVEDAIAAHPAVLEVAVIGIPDPRWGESVRALVVRRADRDDIGEVEIIAHTKAQIARYKAPKSVRFVDALDRLANGKINKVALREKYGKP